MLSCLSSLYLQYASVNANKMYIHYIDVNLPFVVLFNVHVLLLCHDFPGVIFFELVNVSFLLIFSFMKA